MKSPDLWESSKPDPLVSIIVPCRNEERRLPALLHSLSTLDYSHYEVIVVDDQSTDQTWQVASRYPVQKIKAPQRPDPWSGKNWACWVGANKAQGEYLLFTDADTIHQKKSIQKAISWMQLKEVHMLSAPPFHLAQKGFEKWLGLFFLLPLIATDFRGNPREKRHYAIGQYLLFQREAYIQTGGHAAVAPSLVEDMDLAKRFLSKNRNYAVYPFANLYSVQMFDSARAFQAGWIRLIRLGLPRTSWRATVEMIFIFHLLIVGLAHPLSLLGLLMVLGWGLVAWAQVQHAKVSYSSVVLSIFSLASWSLYSVIAIFQSLRKQKINWRGREYIPSQCHPSQSELAPASFSPGSSSRETSALAIEN